MFVARWCGPHTGGQQGTRHHGGLGAGRTSSHQVGRRPASIRQRCGKAEGRSGRFALGTSRGIQIVPRGNFLDAIASHALIMSVSHSVTRSLSPHWLVIFCQPSWWVPVSLKYIYLCHPCHPSHPCHPCHPCHDVMMSRCHDVMKIFLSWKFFCHEIFFVMKIFLSWNFFCHKNFFVMENFFVMKFFLSWKFFLHENFFIMKFFFS